MDIQTVRNDLIQRLDDDADTILAFIQQMVRIPSENPPGDTTALAAFLTGWLAERNLACEIVAPEPTLPNIIASFDGHQPGRHLILNGHLDVFPAGNNDDWSDDPFSGIVRDNKLYGRGVIDMKVGTAASFLTYAYLYERRESLSGKLTLTAVSDEETGGTWGSQYLVENVPAVIGDCVLNGEPSTPYTIRFGEKGPVWLNLIVRTPGGHGAYPHLSRNAIQETAQIIREIERLSDQIITLPPDILERIEDARDEFDAMLGSGATDVARRVSVNIGTIHGGVTTNVIASECRTSIDLRTPVGLSATDLLEQVNQIVARYPSASCDLLAVTEPSFSSPDHEMVRILQRNGEAVRGIRPKPTVSLGGTDCRFWRWRGIPAFVYGPTPHRMGASDEHVTLDDLYGTVRVHLLSAFDYLTGSNE